MGKLNGYLVTSGSLGFVSADPWGPSTSRRVGLGDETETENPVGQIGMGWGRCRAESESKHLRIYIAFSINSYPLMLSLF